MLPPLAKLYLGKGFQPGCDTYVRCAHAGYRSETIPKKDNVSPRWFHTLVVQVPDAFPVSEGPDVVVSAWDDNILQDALIGEVRIPLSTALQSANDARNELLPLPDPTWYELEPRNGCGEVKGQALLFTVEVAEVTGPNPTPVVRSLLPPTQQLFIQFVCIGVRSLRPHGKPPPRKPHLLFNVGDRGTAQTRGQTPRSSTPSARNPNYLQVVTLPFPLPTNPIFFPTLDVDVRDDLFGGLTKLSLGHATIHLLPAWQQLQSGEETPRSAGSMKSVLVERQRFDEGLGVWQSPLPGSMPAWADSKGTPKTKNQVVLNGEEWVWEGDWTVDVGVDCDSHGWRYALAFKASKWSSSEVGCAVRKRRWIRVQSVPQHDVSLAERVVVAQGKDQEDPRIPEWRKGRASLDKGLELYFRERAFETYDVMNVNGGSRKVGSISGRLRLLHQPEAKSAFLQSLVKPKRYEVRLYVLECVNLMPADSCGTSDPYLMVRLGDEQQGSRDKHRSRVTNAEFYQTFLLGAYLPGASKLSIEVWDFDLMGGDDLIGKTEIDLEARVFNDEWSQLAIKPIEWRPLKHPKSKHPQGLVELFVDIVPATDCGRVLLWHVAPPTPQDWELRVVVWKTCDCKPMDKLEQMNDMFATVKLGNAEQQTDTHWRCANGNASFNWRMKFPTTLEHKSSLFHRLHIQLWDRDIVSSNDCIGEHVLDLSPWLQRCFWLSVPNQAAGTGSASPVIGASSAPAPTPAPAVAASLVAPDSHTSAEARQQSKSFHFDGGHSARETPPQTWRLSRSIMAKLIEGDNYDRPPDLGASGTITKFWIEARGLDNVTNGWVQLSVEAVPRVLAEAKPCGHGRSEPNSFPKCPPPTGRISLSLNPFKMTEQLIGKELSRKLCGMCCCCTCCLLFAYILFMMLPALLGDALTGKLS